jgi:hypothetical protein
MLVESIASYVMRLASKYSISTIALLRTALPALIPKPIKGGRGRPNEVAKSGAYAVGMTRTSEQWVAELEAATGLDGLEALTLLSWEPAVSAYRLPRTQVAFCRACLHDMAAAGFVWEPLIWTLQLVTTCPVHGSPLLTTCPHCGGSQNILRLRGRPGICGRCRRWLGAARAAKPTAPDALSAMVASLFSGRLAVSDDLAKTLNAGLARLGWTAIQLSDVAQVPDPSLSGWRTGRMKPGLGPVVAICRATGWDLAAFLAGEIVQASAPVRLPNRSSARVAVDWAGVSGRLHEMTERSQPPSFRAVAADLDLSLKAIRRHLPEEVAALVGRRRDLVTAAAQERRVERTTLVTNLTIGLLEAGSDASRRDLEPLLPEGWQLREKVLGDAWRTARAAWQPRAA